MHLGPSPEHSETVGRILNLDTGAITPQYHVVHDKLFSTVHGAHMEELFDRTLWNGLTSLGGEENHLDPRDRTNDSVVTPAMDLFRAFVDSAASVPEGEDTDSPPVTDSDEDVDDDADNDTVLSSDSTLPIRNLNAVGFGASVRPHSGRSKPTDACRGTPAPPWLDPRPNDSPH